MNISIFGLGYVGAVSAGCLAREGHKVIGVDPYQPKVDLINAGQTPIIEKDIGEIIASAVAESRLRATTDVLGAVQGSEMSLICVGTPSQLNGSLDLKYVRKVCEEIGAALKEKDTFHVVVARSTMLPGSMRNIVIPTLEEFSGKRAGVDFGVCNNPEFLREGTAVYDYYNPPKTVIGETDSKAGDMLAGLYAHLNAPLIRTDIETAEMVKYTDNVWHALKVGFANEIGNICKVLGIDGYRVMDIFCQDTKLNLSPYYMKPGFAFGGSCLPKDVRALNYKARSLDLDVPIISSIMQSNQYQIKKGIKMIAEKGNKKVGILGFSFKAGTDDLRESPMVEVVEWLLGKGYDIRLYDRNVKIASLVGANKDYILNHIPHISKLMVDDIDSVLEHAETIVIGNKAEEFRDIPERIAENQVIVDLVRISEKQSIANRYDGICW
ncbi:UDP-glucose/GDP-mannose dehydrogenase family protein [Thiohalobacter sp. IOR34]|uniref:nucleotide sugar dehydrogenase n=1 Tax=Thiohalobacter sp. IOR34 TaxID=3057176 RepID=UPI0025B21B8E|nr:UDP-glucose/GDP-mannose dehydrogenase family protein [Thiohalobacter sp. IOR34]WJW75296.1 UDP-glucose/GDP-mannose dehydrogenase family protein [Thiohalobacter sp. IOR34]